MESVLEGVNGSTAELRKLKKFQIFRNKRILSYDAIYLDLDTVFEGSITIGNIKTRYVPFDYSVNDSVLISFIQPEQYVKIFYLAVMLALNADSTDNFPVPALNPLFSSPRFSSFFIANFTNKLVFEYNKFPFLSTTITFAQKKKKRKTRCIAKGFIVLSDRDGRRVNLDKSVAEIVDKMATTRAQLAQNNNQIVCLECCIEFCNIFSHKQCELIIY